MQTPEYINKAILKVNAGTDNYEVSIENKDILNYDSDTGTITALKAGSTRIRAYALYSGLIPVEKFVNVEVEEWVDFSVLPDNIQDLEVGRTQNMIITPNHANITNITIRDDTICSYDTDLRVITALKAGSTQIDFTRETGGITEIKSVSVTVID